MTLAADRDGIKQSRYFLAPLLDFGNDFFGAEAQPFISTHGTVSILVNGRKYFSSVLGGWIRIGKTNTKTIFIGDFYYAIFNSDTV